MSIYGGPDIVTNGLVLHLDAGNTKSYPGSGTNWFDLSGNNNGTFINGPTFNVSNNGRIVFDGINDYIGIINPSILQLQNFSISIWMNPSTATQAITAIIDYDHTSPGFQGWVVQSEDATSNRNYYLAYYDGSAFQPATGIGTGKGIQVVNTRWQNLVYTKNNTNILGYLNGTQSMSYVSNNANISYSNNRNMRIGSVVANFNRYYTGNISAIIIYNRALSASEISQNYNAIKGRFGL